MKDGQHNGQKKKYKRKHKILQNITQKTNDWAIRVHLKTRGELGCSGRVCSSCCTQNVYSHVEVKQWFYFEISECLSYIEQISRIKCCKRNIFLLRFIQGNHGVRKSYTFLKVHELDNKQQKLEGKVNIEMICELENKQQKLEGKVDIEMIL